MLLKNVKCGRETNIFCGVTGAKILTMFLCSISPTMTFDHILNQLFITNNCYQFVTKADICIIFR